LKREIARKARGSTVITLRSKARCR